MLGVCCLPHTALGYDRAEWDLFLVGRSLERSETWMLDLVEARLLVEGGTAVVCRSLRTYFCERTLRPYLVQHAHPNPACWDQSLASLAFSLCCCD